MNTKEESVMSIVDIAVVGGGPAGLSAAYAAAKGGAKVVLFEKDQSIAHCIRTSGVTWISEMERLGIPSKFYNPIQNYRFVSPSNDILITGNVSKSCVLDIRGMYQHLAFLAAKEGVMGLSSQSLSDTEKRIFRKILKAANATARGRRRLDKKLGRISQAKIKQNSTVSKNIAAEIIKQIIDPYRRRHPDA